MSMSAFPLNNSPRSPRRRTSPSRAIQSPSLDAAPPVALTPELFLAQEQPSLLGQRNRLGPRLHAKLSIDARQVRLDGLDRDAQALPDLAVARAPHDQAQHFQFARG